MGITIREIVEEIGGGMPKGRRFKAVQLGGPSGGCLPAQPGRHAGRLRSARRDRRDHGLGRPGGARRPRLHGGYRPLLPALHQAESCGKCTFCRIGTKRMLEILERLCAGHGRRGGPGEARGARGPRVSRGSLCGLGQTAPNPVLTTLRYFRDEYEAHMREKRCPAGRCAALIRLPHQRGLHRLHALRAGVPGRRDRVPPSRAARDRPDGLHALRHVLRGLRGRCGGGGVGERVCATSPRAAERAS